MSIEYDGWDEPEEPEEFRWKQHIKRLQSGKFKDWTLLFREKKEQWNGEMRWDHVRVLPPSPYPRIGFPHQTSKDWISETWAGFPLELSEILKMYWDYKNTTGEFFAGLNPLEFMVRQLQE
jgi:hypothetical protein